MQKVSKNTKALLNFIETAEQTTKNMKLNYQ
jgi:hypothetical protein